MKQEREKKQQGREECSQPIKYDQALTSSAGKFPSLPALLYI
jgi:hypothetical protein